MAATQLLVPRAVATGAVVMGVFVALLAWLPVHTLWSLMDGWAALVHEVDRATSYEQIEQAAGRFRRLIGENTAHVVVMLVTSPGAGASPRCSWPTASSRIGSARATTRTRCRPRSRAEADRQQRDRAKK